MSSPSSNPGDPLRTLASDEVDLESILADYLQRQEQGSAPNPAVYLQAYPQHAEELRSFFRNHHWLGEPPAAAEDSLIGTWVGPYCIEQEIARGGMGVVYRARQKGLERPVALKLIRSGVLAGKEERQRFRIEAEAAARLHHPGIIAIHEIGSWQGHEYFSMALVEGQTLQSRVDAADRNQQDACQLVYQIARAVGYAHRAGIVHRDLKPENILLDSDGRPLVADFGLAKWHRDGTMITRTGQVLGTPHYMSPEQACGRSDGEVTTDVYSLGAILYALLTGRPPHGGDSAAEVLRSVLQDEPEPPRCIRREISAELEKICLKAIAYEPGQRYPTADALADDLQRFMQGEPTSADSSGFVDRVAREIRRDQHQSFFENWARTLVVLGGIIFASHLVMFALAASSQPRWLSFWTPRFLMLVLIFTVIQRARGGWLLPRKVAERPIWSIWLGYLATLGVINVLVALDSIEHKELFTIAAAMSGFGFIAMAGHVWGGSALLGLLFLAVSLANTHFPTLAPLLFGGCWLFSLSVLAHHYHRWPKG